MRHLGKKEIKTRYFFSELFDKDKKAPNFATP
jgi:hypothetical protein